MKVGLSAHNHVKLGIRGPLGLVITRDESGLISNVVIVTTRSHGDARYVTQVTFDGLADDSPF